MASPFMTASLQQVTRLLREGTLNALTDDRLLDRFFDQGDEDAFAAIVGRHGPMVLQTCLKVLRDPSDAEDAFQATFLTLVRKAGSIRGRDCVGGWLRRVAHRSAIQINASPVRRRDREQMAISRAGSVARSSVSDRLDRTELNQVLCDEIDRLPEPYRRPVLLCLVEGLPQPEVAGQLCVSEGVIRGRLARARALLRDRLTRRGMSPHNEAPLVPASWVGAILAAARVLNAGRAASFGWVGTPIKVSAALLVMVGTLCVAASLPQSPAQTPPQLTPAVTPVTAKPTVESGRTVVFRGKVVGPDGHPVAGAKLALVNDAWAKPESRGSSDADGSYRIVLPEETFRRNFTPSSTSPRVQIVLLATAKGFGSGWIQIQAGMRDGQPAMQPEYLHNLQLVDDRPIQGRILDTNGKPVAGAIVEVRRIRTVTGGDWKPILDEFKKFNVTNLWNGFNYIWPLNIWSILPTATTDADGRFQLAGAGRDRLIDLAVTGPGIRLTEFSVITVDNVAEITQALRSRYPRTMDGNGIFLTQYNMPRNVHPAVMVFDTSPTIAVQRGQTVSGVVRNARTGEPIPDLNLAMIGRSGSGSAQMTTDQHGRYRGTREDHETSISVHAMSYQPERYLSAIREFNDAKVSGEIKADFNIEPGVMLTGRVLEAGTDHPIVSSVRWDCHVEGQVVAGRVEYFPLSTNTALRLTPTGLYFVGSSPGKNNSVSHWIDGDGRFRMVIPPGPGVLFVHAAAGLPMSLGFPIWKESEGLHKLFPYATLTTRAKNDQAPGDDPKSFPGFSGPIPLESYHAYKIINPPVDATTFSVDFSIPRAPSQWLRFVGPDGRPVRGVTIAGLLALSMPMTSLEGSQIEALALNPALPRPILALSHDGRYYARDVLADVQPGLPKTIKLEPASSLSGRLLDDLTARPLSGYTVAIAYPDEDHIPVLPTVIKTDAEGRFLIPGIIPDLRLAISFHPPTDPANWALPTYRPNLLQRVTLRIGEARAIGDIRMTIEKPK